MASLAAFFIGPLAQAFAGQPDHRCVIHVALFAEPTADSPD
jgi:hypothetical protein